jgi:hypothetical protein
LTRLGHGVDLLGGEDDEGEEKEQSNEPAEGEKNNESIISRITKSVSETVGLGKPEEKPPQAGGKRSRRRRKNKNKRSKV